MQSQFDEIESTLERMWATDEEVGEAFFGDWWLFNVLPTLRNRAVNDSLSPETYRAALKTSRRLARNLFGALHCNAGYAAKKEAPTHFWHHQAHDLIRANDATRGFAIDRQELTSVAADYLSHPEIRTNPFDSVLLDALIFAELDAFTDHMVTTKAGTGINWAKMFAGHSWGRYLSLLTLFSLVGFALRYLAAPALAAFLLQGGFDVAALSIVGLWAVYLCLRLAGFPTRRRARKKSIELLERLTELYGQLGTPTISPRRLKEALDKTAASGVVLDGAVFGIVDRMMVRDPTAFVSHKAVA